MCQLKVKQWSLVSLYTSETALSQQQQCRVQQLTNSRIFSQSSESSERGTKRHFLAVLPWAAGDIWRTRFLHYYTCFRAWIYGSRQVHFLGLRQCRTSPSDSIGPPTASDFNLRQHRTSTSDSIGPQPPTASDLRQCRTSTSDIVRLHLRQCRLLSPTASDRTTISDSVGLQSPTAS